MKQANENLSLLDNDQIIKREHDQASDAKRVVIVNSDYSAQIAESIKESLKDIKIDVTTTNVAQPQQAQSSSVQIIEIPVIVKEIEIKEVEKIVVVENTKTVEIPVIVIQEKIVEIEKPIFIYKETKHEKDSKFTHYLLIAQTFVSIVLSIMHFLSLKK
jgi:hypothetical protein